VCVLFAMVLGCSMGQGPEAIEVREAVAEDALIVAMEAHWDAAEALRDASARGQVDEAKKAAQRIVDDEVTVPPQYRGSHDELRLAAGRVLTSSDAAGVARASAEVAGLCGSCHAQAGAQVDLLPRLPKPEGDADPAMMWHQLANVHLWAGVVSQDPERWKHGAEALGKARFDVDDGTARGGKGAEFEANLHALGAQAATADKAEWAALYGRILETCAECHAR
jgi:cytochrome c553